MNNSYRHSLGASLLAMVESLRASVTAAGGATEIICSVQNLREISAFDLLCTLATNDVRFVYTPPEGIPTPTEKSYP